VGGGRGDGAGGEAAGNAEPLPESVAAGLDRRFELLEAVLLAIAAVLTAWAGFQSTKWSGVQADSYSRAGAARTESVRASTTAGQLTAIDVDGRSVRVAAGVGVHLGIVRRAVAGTWTTSFCRGDMC
jgi:hypothetical protein